MSDFTKFKKWFRYYQEKFGLLGWRVYFEKTPLDDCFVLANVTLDMSAMVATVKFNSQPNKDAKSRMNIKDYAKHETIHLLIGRLAENSRYRYITSEEIYETTEELVNKLCELID